MEEYFEEYYDVLEDIKSEQGKLIAINSNMYSIHSVNFDFQKTSGGKKEYDSINEMFSKDKILENLINLGIKKNQLYKKYSDIIKINIKDKRRQNIAILIYLDKLSHKEIATTYNKTYRWSEQQKKSIKREFLKKVNKSVVDFG